MSAPKGRHTAAPNYYDDSRARLEAERSATRETTRELHETVQEARDTLGELDRTMATVREWTKHLGEDLQGIIQELVNKRTREVNEHFQRNIDRVNQQFAAVGAKMEHLTGLIIATEHEVMGLPDKQKVMEILVRRIEEVTRMKLDEQEFREQVAGLVAEELGELWGASKASFRLRPKGGGRGQVIVRTAEPGERLGMYVEGQYVEGSG